MPKIRSESIIIRTVVIQIHGGHSLGLETSRTQGETVGQIMAYIGARPARNSSAWNPKYELIPVGELGRPRIDVTVNICGFFRICTQPH